MSSMGPKTKLVGSPLFLGHCVVRVRAVEVIWTSVFLCSNDPCKQPPWASISMLFMVLMTEYDTFFLVS